MFDFCAQSFNFDQTYLNTGLNTQNVEEISHIKINSGHPDFNANTRDFEAERKAYEYGKRSREGYSQVHDSDKGFHAEQSAEAPDDGVMQKIKEMRAKNSNLTMRSAEKTRKGKTPGPIDCSPENVIAKQEHSLEGSPNIRPDLVIRNGNGQYKLSKDTNTSGGYAYQSTMSPPQYSYTEDPIQEGVGYMRVKIEQRSDPP